MFVPHGRVGECISLTGERLTQREAEMIGGRLAESHISGHHARPVFSSREDADPPDRIGPVLLTNLIAKLVAMTLAIIAIAIPGLPQFQGKWMAARAVPTIGLVFLVPGLWWIRGRRAPYPHLLDILVVLAIVGDMSGNVLNLYDTIKGFDLATHFFGWAFLVTAFGLLISRFPLSRLNVAGLAIGFGATTHILWEIAEYGMMKSGAFGLHLTYANTVHDLLFSLLGTVVGAALTVTVLWSYLHLRDWSERASPSAPTRRHTGC